MFDGWLIVEKILIGYILLMGLCFVLMYLVGWLVVKKYEKSKKAGKK